MASGTINGTTGNQYIDAKIEWVATPYTEKNQSYVTARLYYKRNNDGYTTYGTGTFSIAINGVKTTVTKYVTISEDGWVKVAEAGEWVSHATNGTKSIAISASGSIPGTSLNYTSVSGTAVLNTIPRASVISSVGGNLGASCKVKWTPHSTSFRYKIHFQLGDWSHITEAIHPNTTTAYTYTGYKYPFEVAEQIPSDSREGVMTATLYTYSDSSCKNQLGVPSSKDFGIMIFDSHDELAPTVVMKLSPVTSLGSPFNTMYIQGRTKVRADFTGSEAKYGATISKYTMTVGGKDNGSHTSGYLSTAGEVTVSGWAKDSRGLYSKTIKKTITVIPYQKPKIFPASGEKAIICARCDANGNLSESGTYLKIKARRSYSKVTSDGEQNNFCTIRYRYREESATSFSAWKTILAGTTLASDTADTAPMREIVTSTTTAYVVQVGVVDSIGESDAIQFMIPTDSVTIDIPEKHKGKRIGLLRYAQDIDEEGIDVGAPIHGGGVDNLTLGEKITATSAAPIDLNNIKTPGNYYSPSATNSEYIQNSPYTTGGFSLIVREIQSVNMIRQELFYGRTNWQRHYNSSDGTWSEWLRYLMTEYPETTAADFVTETGVWNIDNSDTNKGYWRYRKWKSGAIDMNGLIKVEPVSEGTLGTAGVYYSQVIYIDLPFEVVNFQFTGSSTSYHIFVGNTNSVDGNNKQIRLRLYRFTDFSSLNEYDVYVRIVASGKLK